MNNLDYAIDILKDDLNEIREMQWLPKYAVDEITFKQRRQSLELAIKKLNNANDIKMSIRELLSDYAHEAWCGWMRYMFTKAELNNNGTWTMPQWAVERWQRQMNTKYNKLPEDEKKSDREEADKITAIFHR